jgi:hypothetical protein
MHFEKIHLILVTVALDVAETCNFIEWVSHGGWTHDQGIGVDAQMRTC